MQAAYAFSKSLDETSTTITQDFLGNDQMPNVYNFRANRGPSDFDIRHAMTLNGSYQLPWRGKSIPRRIFGGWEAHGLLLVRTGSPFSPWLGYDRANLTAGVTDLGQRPDFSAAPGTNLILGGVNRYFDPTAFSLQPAGFIGNLGRNVLTGPGLASIDAALHKILWNTERQSLRLRAEAYNVGNHPNFQIPSGLALFNDRQQRLATAGRITQTTTSSRQLQLALRWEF